MDGNKRQHCNAKRITFSYTLVTSVAPDIRLFDNSRIANVHRHAVPPSSFQRSSRWS